MGANSMYISEIPFHLQQQLHLECRTGPLLFILYINDITNVSNVLQPIVFVDDTSLVETHTETLTRYLQRPTEN